MNNYLIDQPTNMKVSSEVLSEVSSSQFFTMYACKACAMFNLFAIL